MSIKLISQVLDSTLSSTEKFVAVIYADHANDEGEHIYPSIAKTAKRTSLDPRTVQRATRALEEKGILEFVGETRKRTFEYRMIATKLPTGETAESMTPADDHPQAKASHDPGRRSPMTPADDHHDPGRRSPMTPADDHPIRYSDPLFETYIETSEGPNWDNFNLPENTGGEQQDVTKAQFDNGKLSPGQVAPPDPWQEPPAVTQPPQQEPKPKRGKAKKPVEPITFALPDPINTPQVLQLLNELVANRIEIGKPMTQRAANMIVESVADLTIPEIVARLRTAITRNWLAVRFPGDDYQYAQYRSGGNGNGNGRAYTNGAKTGQQTAVKTWKPGGSY